jgi:hypothetical protein
MKFMMRMKKGFVVLAVVTGVSILAGCWNPVNPTNVPPSPPPYYTFCDSAWKVIKNLEYSYQARDIVHYMACFRSDFEFHLLEVDWANYWGSAEIDTWWGLDVEEEFHIAMFDFVDDIELELSGIAEWPWSPDSTGQSWELPRTFTLKVYYTVPGSPWTGSQASGSALFICRADTSTGEWYIWQWFDQSET